MNYLFHVSIYLSIYFIVAMSLNIVVGYCGLLTMAHAGYFAIGSYVYALATVKMGLGLIPSLVLGAAIAATLSLMVSLPSWRLKGDFFIMITLVVQSLLFTLFTNWAKPGMEVGTWINLTNGPFGISGIAKPTIFGSVFDTIGGVAAICAVIAGMCGIFSWIILGSPWGRLLKSIRDDDLSARGLGKDPRKARLQAFAIACGMAAIAGGLYASYVSYIDPSSASLDYSILMLSMVIVGGVGNFRGPLVGASLLIVMPEVLRFINIPDAVAANIRQMAYGLLLVIIVHFRPQGLAGDYKIE